MLAAIDDVHHRGRKQIRAGTTEVSVKRLLREVRSRFGDSERDSKNRVCTEILFVGCAIELAHFVVDADLIECVPAF